MMDSDDRTAPLREDVRTLGSILGNTIAAREGESALELVERIRELSKKIRSGGGSLDELREATGSMDAGTQRLIARCFAQFLNLSNVAEQHHRIRRRLQKERAGESVRGSMRDTVESLVDRGIPVPQIMEAVKRLSIEVVMTAHPTEVSRRTLLALNRKIGDLLLALDSEETTPRRRRRLEEELRRTVVTIWETEELRREKPSAIYEAQGGLMIFEQTIWRAIPRLMRRLDEDLREVTGEGLPEGSYPFRFGSWAGGDRDGNPNVTAGVTLRTTLRARWLASTLIRSEIEELREELSIEPASEQLRERTGNAGEPYRVLLGSTVRRLTEGIEEIERALEEDRGAETGSLPSVDEVREALELCRDSLVESGLERIANGKLLDVRRLLETFGLTLIRLDIRQEAGRHAQAIAEIGHPGWSELDEDGRIEFLLDALREKSRVSAKSETPEVEETVETFRTIGSLPPDSFGAYVISMAAKPSDVLAVEYLQRCVGSSSLRVVPLFETLDDLENAPEAMARLFEIEWYREVTGLKQEVMIGYSDSARDGSRLAANWALFRAQERLARVAEEHGFTLTIFHGRGGTVSRGGGPTQVAIRSQPVETVRGSLRVTEQGEMIQARFGLTDIAVRTLEVYASAVLETTLIDEEKIEPEWRKMMDELSAASTEAYRRIVYQHSEFVPYFRSATPEPELGGLNIGSRPARRKKGGGVESLRAIPWVFAWTQTRLLLPAWLGADEALGGAIEAGHLSQLQEMYERWPFFRSTIDLIEMVLAKALPSIAEKYDEALVPEELRALGAELRSRLERVTAAILEITGHERLLDTNPVLRKSIDVRNPYVDPINLIQIEVLERMRNEEVTPELHDAFVTTVNGIAAGMRNTG